MQAGFHYSVFLDFRFKIAKLFQSEGLMTARLLAFSKWAGHVLRCYLMQRRLTGFNKAVLSLKSCSHIFICVSLGVTGAVRATGRSCAQYTGICNAVGSCVNPTDTNLSSVIARNLINWIVQNWYESTVFVNEALGLRIAK